MYTKQIYIYIYVYKKYIYIYTYFPLNIVRVFGVSQYLFLNKNPANILTACEKPFRVTSNADRPLSKGRDVTTFSAIFFQKRLPTKKKVDGTQTNGDSFVI